MKNDPAIIEYSLQEAHAAIATELRPLEQELLPLPQALGRINATSIFASHPKPSYTQATRDGFALAEQPHVLAESIAEFYIRGERAAGCTEQQEIQPGQAYRIMTGAMLPGNTARVVPLEICREKGTRLSVSRESLSRKQLYIRPQGQDIQQGQCLVAGGTQLGPDQLLLLAENGEQQLRVYRRPRVAVICTGNELIQSGKRPLPGQKVSTNGVLLASLLQEQYCDLVRSITAKDNLDAIVEQLKSIFVQDKPDLVISTGGTGPGKFDLMDQVVACLGGNPLYNLLKIRPGKSTLFAMIGSTPLFALPGPPPAVRLLFYELILPGLHRLQGLANHDLASSGLVDALLTEPVRLRQTGHLALKTAIASVCDGYVRVRPSKGLEPMNAIMHLACTADGKAGHGEIGKNQQVKVRLVGPLASSKQHQ